MPEQGIKFDDFTNPNSMITPGAAGAITMVITNVLTSQFANLPGNWTALALSFLFGSLTFVYAAGLVARMAYFIINSLIIFVMAHGSNGIGMATTQAANAAPKAEYAISSSAGLAGVPEFAPVSFSGERPTGKALSASLRGNLIFVQAQTEKSKDKGFFKAWSWSGK